MGVALALVMCEDLTGARDGARARNAPMWPADHNASPCRSNGSEEDKGVDLSYLSSSETEASSFANGDLGEVRHILESNVRPAPAKVGPIDVIVPKGPTGCDPGQTTFFQTLQI